GSFPAFDSISILSPAVMRSAKSLYVAPIMAPIYGDPNVPKKYEHVSDTVRGVVLVPLEISTFGHIA
ncbi:hypothetical protein PIB30_112039, partial [Stylosanthes scabra]|nr:hypothetical protein [Stylosanthes scabra]